MPDHMNDYRKKQINKAINSHIKPITRNMRIKIMGENSAETPWMNITVGQVRMLIDILESQKGS